MSKLENNENKMDQENFDAVMKKIDRESNTRVFTGKYAVAVKALMICFSLFCIWVTLFATFLEEIRLTSFMGMIVFFGFLYYPVSKKNNKVNYMPGYDIIFMLVGSGAFFYYTFTKA